MSHLFRQQFPRCGLKFIYQHTVLLQNAYVDQLVDALALLLTNVSLCWWVGQPDQILVVSAGLEHFAQQLLSQLKELNLLQRVVSFYIALASTTLIHWPLSRRLLVLARLWDEWALCFADHSWVKVFVFWWQFLRLFGDDLGEEPVLEEL